MDQFEVAVIGAGVVGLAVARELARARARGRAHRGGRRRRGGLLHRRQPPGLVNLFGIESPGLTASLAPADQVADLL